MTLTSCHRTFTCIAVVPVANHIVKDLEGHTDKSSSVLLVTIWELGEAAGPLFIAPLSEVIGRYPVMNACNIVFILATILASLSPTASVLIAARFLTGLAVASNVLNPSIVGDMFVSDQRGTAMSFIMLAPLIGGAIGPAISGAIAETLGWREMLLISAGLATVCEIAFLTFFRETFKVPILNRRAARLRSESGDPTYRTVFEIENSKKTGSQFWEQVLRPFVVFFGSGVLQALSLIEAVAFTYFYVMSTTLPEILENMYNLSAAATGAAFIAFSKSLLIFDLSISLTRIGVGSIISVTLCNRLLDRIYIRLRDSNKGAEQPEYRLPLAIAGNIFLPITVVLYGWAAELHLPVVWVLISLGVLGAGLMLATLPLMSYVVDAFGMYSASAMTAVIVTRCLMGTFLPLATEPLIDRLGYGLAFTCLGILTLALAPIPIVIMRYGHKWRQRSAYTKDE